MSTQRSFAVTKGARASRSSDQRDEEPTANACLARLFGNWPVRLLARGTSGQSLVEFALLLPIVTWLLFGVVDFGRLYYSYLTVTNASRVGAEFAMDPRVTIAEIKSVVKQESAALNITDSDIDLTANPSWAAGNELTVVVRHGFQAVTPLISGLWGGGPITVTGKTITRFNSP